MNEELVEAMESSSDPTECNPTPPQNEEAALPENSPPQTTKRGENDEKLFEEAPEDSLLPANPDQDPDPDHGFDPAEDQTAELERLRGELKDLQDQLARKDARLEQISAEFEEFNTLYPNTPLSSLEDSVWADVQRGIPIAAAYALEKRRQEHTARAAALSNMQNASRSSGALNPTPSDYFSPAEVRAMSQSEVRANYQKIIQSMQKWR